MLINLEVFYLEHKFQCEIWQALVPVEVIDPIKAGNMRLLKDLDETLLRIVKNGDLQMQEQFNPCLHGLIRLQNDDDNEDDGDDDGDK